MGPAALVLALSAAAGRARGIYSSAGTLSSMAWRRMVRQSGGPEMSAWVLHTPTGALWAVYAADRDGAYGGDFVARTKRIGIEVVLMPIRFASGERGRGATRGDVATRVPRPPDHREQAAPPVGADQFVRHYNEARPHRALELEVPLDAERPPRSPKVTHRPVLCGLTHEYEPEAA